VFFRIGILVSGGGSNMEALIEAGKRGTLPHAEIALVISNRPEAGALLKAQAHGIPTLVIASKNVPDEVFQTAVLNALEGHKIDIVCLAGYLKKVGPVIVKHYHGRILNIHPALLPKYGGTGMYGHFVHEAVIKACEVESGCTVHLVDDEFDHGDVLAQARVPVQPGDTPERLAERILMEEHKLYPKTVGLFCEQLIASRSAIDD
jgi:formyltetrahydrofolate-dependent phosphoribosylglycinamide formyltransferase